MGAAIILLVTLTFSVVVVSELSNGQATLLILGIEHGDGSYSSVPERSTRLKSGDRVILYGSEEEHRALCMAVTATPERSDFSNPEHR